MESEERKQMSSDKYIISFCVFIFLIFMAANPQITSEYVKKALEICYLVIIPSIFPFIVMIKILGEGPIFRITGKISGGLSMKLFGVSGEYFSAYIIGLIAGFPLAADICADVYKNGGNKREAEKTLAFANNCSLAFILSAVGLFIFGSVKVGLILFLIQALSSFITGIVINRIYKTPPSKKNISCTSLPTDKKKLAAIVAESVNSMLFVCGVIIFFYTAVNILLKILEFLPFLNDSPVVKSILRIVFSGFFELSTGIYSLSDFNGSLMLKLCAASSILAFSGLSVHVQIMGTVKNANLSLKPYFTGKAIHVIISVLITFFAAKSGNLSVNVFSHYYSPTSNHAEIYPACLILTAICAAICAAVCGIFYLIILSVEKYGSERLKWKHSK